MPSVGILLAGATWGTFRRAGLAGTTPSPGARGPDAGEASGPATEPPFQCASTKRLSHASSKKQQEFAFVEQSVNSFPLIQRSLPRPQRLSISSVPGSCCTSFGNGTIANAATPPSVVAPV